MRWSAARIAFEVIKVRLCVFEQGIMPIGILLAHTCYASVQVLTLVRSPQGLALTSLL